MFKKNDWIFGMVSVALGVFVLFNIDALRDIRNSMDPAGPAALPGIIAWSMIAIGLVHIIASFILMRRKNQCVEIKNSKSMMPVIKISFAAVIFIFLLPIIGYPVAMPLLIASIMFSLGVKEKKRIAIVSILTSIVLFASFSFALKVDLPLGFFERLF